MLRSIVFVILIVNSFSLINCDENLTSPFLIYSNFCSMVKNSTIAPIESLCISYVALAKTLEDLTPKNENDLLADCKKTLSPSELNYVIKSCSDPLQEAEINKGADCVKKLGNSKKLLSKKPLDALVNILKSRQLEYCLKQ